MSYVCKNIFGLNNSVLDWFEKIKGGLEARGFVQSQVYPCVIYIEDFFLLFYVDDCLIFSPSKDKLTRYMYP